jgi:hypothetical protein
MADHGLVTRMKRALAYLTCGFVAVLATACGDDEPLEKPTRRGDVTPPASAQARRWMPVDSRLTPAQWLASRDASEPRPHDDPAVRQLSTDLAAANRLYRESERMIANRAAQLEDMLREIGVAESAANILEDLARLPGETGQTEGFGAISQHYYNLRANHVDRQTALAQLQSRYGKRP